MRRNLEALPRGESVKSSDTRDRVLGGLDALGSRPADRGRVLLTEWALFRIVLESAST